MAQRRKFTDCSGYGSRGCRGSEKKTVALVDEGDVHTLMVGAAGVGKTAFFLYPNLKLACASGMSFINTDCKGDVARNYGTIAKKYYGYNVSVLDLRNPTRSDENNKISMVRMNGSSNEPVSVRV